MRNILSVDLEDWFHVHNLRDAIPPATWSRCESRVVANTQRLLGLFRKRGVHATFFVLGWVAERFPELVHAIEDGAHEVASHGYGHLLVSQMTPAEFEADLTMGIGVLRSLASQPVRGFRAPSFSITRPCEWAYDVLARQGVEYCSSVFPIGFHPDYGIRDAPLVPYRTPSGVLEIPMSCAEFFGMRIPCSGGGYFRLLPYAATRALMRSCNSAGRPVVFYVHPWEIDPDQPRVPLPAARAFRHYNNLHKTYGRLERLLGDFEFGTLSSVVVIQ